MALTTAEQVYQHVERLFNLSDCRTPLVLSLEDGDPQKSIEILAKRQGCAVWKISMDTPRNEQNALDYLEVGLQNGDWLYLVQCEKATTKVLRDIAIQLMTIQPDPKSFPRRELFRLWLLVERHVDLNDTVHTIFPAILTQNALYGKRDAVQNRNKVSAKKKVDPQLAENQLTTGQYRREKGQDSDDESDDAADNPQKKVTGMWFHRHVDFYEADADNVVTRSVEDIFDAIEKGDIDKVKQIISLHTVDLNTVTKAGFTPLMWAIMCDNMEMMRLLLSNEADPNIRRKENGCPPMFLSLEDPAMLQLLLDYGADIDARWEGKSLLDHPDTAPAIKEFVRQYLSPGS